MPIRIRSLLARSALFLALAIAAGCGAEQPQAGAGPAPGLATEAEAALRALGEGRFDVLDFRVEETRDFTFVDDNEWAVSLRAVRFVAHARFTRDLHVLHAAELGARVGAADWTPDESLTGEALLDALGPGRREAGEVAEIRAAAVFEYLGPGFRHRAFDRRR